MNHRVRGAFAGLLLATTAVGSPAQAATQPRDLRREVLDAARARGVDATPLLAREITLPGGTTTLGALLDAAGRASSPGIGGTPETQAGKVMHYAFSSGGFGLPMIYRVTESAIVPWTPPVAVDLPGPLPWSRVTEYGGPLRQVKTNPYLFGYHFVGGGEPSVSTSSEGDPIFVPGVGFGLLSDTAMDFTGHAIIVNIRQCLYVFCVAFGSVVGDGVAIYGNEPIADTIPRPGTPTIP